MTYGERWRLLVVHWRFMGLKAEDIEMIRKRYRIAKREGRLAKMLAHWEAHADLGRSGHDPRQFF